MIDKESIYYKRKNYIKHTLEEDKVSLNPIEQFRQWLEEAQKHELHEVNAMCLSTVDEHFKPSSRIVLLRAFDNKGFVFFTNYQSRKGLEINKNPFGAILFFWPELERQVRIEGQIQKLNAKESDAYFDTRPEESRISAIVSPQSQKINNREELQNKITEFGKTLPSNKINRPDYWGGYLLIPEYMEFWQGREHRLHDRLVFSLDPDKVSWIMERLAP